jgi:hypothetical protein
MPRRTTLLHMLVAALAVSVLAASPALARPVDRIDRFDYQTAGVAATTSAPQDLRGEHARDAARAAESQSKPTASPVRGVPVRSSGADEESWYILVIGLATIAIAAAGAAGIARRNRLRTRRAVA